MPRQFIILLITTSALLASTGCGTRNFRNDNDILREEVMTLEKENDDLRRRNAELATELQLASARPDSIPEAVRAATPHVTALSIGRLSHFRDTNDDGVLETLTIYITPVDGRGRFTQLVGELAVNAAYLPADADAVTIGRHTLSPIEVREAYRAGITGTHYSIDVPVTIPVDLSADSPDATAQVRVIYTDGRTGASISADRSVAMR